MNLKYLVIKCNDLEKSKAFYEAIGFHPVKEKTWQWSGTL
jgi:catechol 2,3-dioxygenase-like lactoylglutathione lyase family enzyme